MAYFDDPIQATLRGEVRRILATRLTDDMTRDQVIETVAGLFHKIEDEWEEIDVSTLAEYPGSSFIRQRSLVLRIPRQAATFTVPPPDDAAR